MTDFVKKLDHDANGAETIADEFIALKDSLIALNAIFEAARTGDEGLNFALAVDDLKKINDKTS